MGRGKPQRTCLGCREVRDQQDLIRFVCSPEGEILVDYRHRLPGRGAYACPERGCLEQILVRRQFQRAFRRECTPVASAALLESVAKALRKRLENLLGMARKAGQSLAGSNAVLAALDRSQPPVVVIFAEDVSAGVADKVERRAKRSGAVCLTLFDKVRLGQIMGRPECSVCALSDASLTEAFLDEWKRYCRILGEN